MRNYRIESIYTLYIGELKKKTYKNINQYEKYRIEALYTLYIGELKKKTYKNINRYEKYRIDALRTECIQNASKSSKMYKHASKCIKMIIFDAFLGILDVY